jgi:hypothetical protein
VVSHVITHRQPNAYGKTHVFTGFPWIVLGDAAAHYQAYCR